MRHQGFTDEQYEVGEMVFEEEMALEWTIAFCTVCGRATPVRRRIVGRSHCGRIMVGISAEAKRAANAARELPDFPVDGGAWAIRDAIMDGRLDVDAAGVGLAALDELVQVVEAGAP